MEEGKVRHLLGLLLVATGQAHTVVAEVQDKLRMWGPVAHGTMVEGETASIAGMGVVEDGEHHPADYQVIQDLVPHEGRGDQSQVN